MTGGKTLWANFYNAMFLLMYLFLAKRSDQPDSAQRAGGRLIYIGYKLCEPASGGMSPTSDANKCSFSAPTVLVHAVHRSAVGHRHRHAREVVSKSLVRPFGDAQQSRRGRVSRSQTHLAGRRRDTTVPQPRRKAQRLGDAYHIQFDGPLVCFNNLHVSNELAKIPADAEEVYLDLTHVALVDHTSCENLLDFVDQCGRNGKKARYMIVGLDRMEKRSAFPSCMRLAYQPAVARGNGSGNGNGHTAVVSASNGNGNGSGNGHAAVSICDDPLDTSATRSLAPLPAQASAELKQSPSAADTQTVSMRRQQVDLARMGLMATENEMVDADGDLCRMAHCEQA